MNRLRLALVALAIAVLTLLPAPALAASEDVVDRLDIAIDIRRDGTLEVTETYHWDFGSRQGLGLTRRLDARFDYPHERDTLRVYRYRDFAVSSPSGAPAGVWVRDEGAQVRVDVGAPDGSSDRRSGVQVYELSYTVTGALNAIRGQRGVADQDELYWNATGHDWDVPIRQASVTVTGPAGVVDHACYQGRDGSTATCDTVEAAGGRVTATGAGLEPGSGLTVMAAYPPGTFDRVDPILEDEPTSPFYDDDTSTAATADFVWRNALWLTPLGLAGPVLLAVWRVRRGRDLHYAHLPPGTFPPPGSTPAVEQLRQEPAAGIRPTPPDGLRPAEVGALTEKEVTTEHISATLLDLAVRGHLRIHEAGTGLSGRPSDWLFVATPHEARDHALTDYEVTLLNGLFTGRHQVTLSQLRNRFARTMRTAQAEVSRAVDRRGLFRRPITQSPLRRVLGNVVAIALLFIVLPFGGALLSAVVPLSTLFLLGVGLALLAALGLAVAFTSKARLQRTATGRALYEQSRAFAHYLSTAAVDRLRLDGPDTFSRHLPYAVVHGAAEHWSALFAQLQAQGGPVTHHSWYVALHGGNGAGLQDLGKALTSFTASTSTSLSSTPGSSGGSGSGGGGGGSSGGGGGGGGGGGR